MPPSTVRLFDPPAAPSPDQEPDRSPRADDTVERSLTSLGAAAWIVFDGPEPTAHPDLERWIERACEAGARVRLFSNGRRLTGHRTLERLRDAGLAQLTLTVWGDEPAHDALTAPGDFAAIVNTLTLAQRLNRLLTTVRFVLTADHGHTVRDALPRLAPLADRLELVTPERLGFSLPAPSREALARSADTALATSAGRPLTTQGLGSWPDRPTSSDAPPRPIDPSLLAMLHEAVPLQDLTAGCRALPDDGDTGAVWAAADAAGGLSALGLQLRALGCPPVDLPAACGGLSSLPLAPALARAFPTADLRPLPAWTGLGRRDRIVVVVPPLTDSITALSTLPGLAAELVSLGATVTLHSVWSAPFNPYDPQADAAAQARPPSETVDPLTATPARIAFAQKHGPDWLTRLDLRDADAVITAGFEAALALLPALPSHARLLLADFHLLTGIQGWHQRFGRREGQPWWPDERIEVTALYPRSVRAYARAGVPARQIRWRPYPIHLPDFPCEPVADHLFAGGAHQRDWTTLARSAPAFRRPLRLHTPDAVPPPLRSQGEIHVRAFHRALASSHAVVLPLRPDERRPAGISVISMALAAGRPVIASLTGSTVDHLRHDHNAILVPPSDPEALRDAVARLDDPQEHARLAAGAVLSGHVLSTAAWATELLDGATPSPTTSPYPPWPDALPEPVRTR